MEAFIVVSTWNKIYAYLLNGIGKIKLQLFTAFIAVIINIPLSILFVKYFYFGAHGVVLATCLNLSLFTIVGPIQAMTILTSKKPVLSLE
jgi:Na+-driven multidrug efflux pump